LCFECNWEIYEVCWYWRNGVYLEPFYPDRMAFMILTLCEIFCFVEKATAEVLDEVVSGVAKMILGIACQINANQITQVEKRFKKNMKRLKKNKAMIDSLAKKEIGNLELFVKDRSCQSRLRRITAD